jgi:hypothetical protein
MSSTTVTPTPSNFDNIPGHQVHEGEISATPEQNDESGDLLGNVKQTLSTIENYTQEGRAEHPVLAQLGDALRNAHEYLSGGQAVGKPQGTESGLANNPATAMVTGVPGAEEGAAAATDYVMDKAGEIGSHLVDTGRTALEAGKEELGNIISAQHPEGSAESGFASIPGYRSEPEIPQGGHAGGGVASEEELNRPGRFVKISRSGVPTDQNKVPDFNLQPGEAGYQVTPEGYELRAGQETPATKRGVEGYHKEVFKPAEKTTGITYRTDSNGTRWAKTPDSPAEVSIPKGMDEKDVPAYAKEKLELQKNFAKSRAEGAQSANQQIKPANVSSSRESKVHDFIGKSIQRMAQEAQGQGVLDDMEDQGISPRNVTKQFWDDTYFKLPAEVQSKFTNYLTKETGFQPGDEIGVTADKQPIVAQDWSHIANEILDVSDDPAHLEGTTRGLVAAMKLANDRIAAATTKTLPAATLASKALAKD